ncbi:hypothetical protein YQE_00580, partial [Dendroctonus ponderosae]
MANAPFERFLEDWSMSRKITRLLHGSSRQLCTGSGRKLRQIPLAGGTRFVGNATTSECDLGKTRPPDSLSLFGRYRNKLTSTIGQLRLFSASKQYQTRSLATNCERTLRHARPVRPAGQVLELWRRPNASFCAHSVSISIGITQGYSAIWLPQLNASADFNVTSEQSSWLGKWRCGHAPWAELTRLIGSQSRRGHQSDRWRVQWRAGADAGPQALHPDQQRAVPDWLAADRARPHHRLAVCGQADHRHCGRHVDGQFHVCGRDCHARDARIPPIAQPHFGQFRHSAHLRAGLLDLMAHHRPDQHLVCRIFSGEHAAVAGQSGAFDQRAQGRGQPRGGRVQGAAVLQPQRCRYRAGNPANAAGQRAQGGGKVAAPALPEPRNRQAVCAVGRAVLAAGAERHLQPAFFGETNLKINDYVSSIMVGSIRFAMSIVCALLIQRVGRKTLCSFSSFGMTLSVLILGLYIKYYEINADEERILTLLPLFCIIFNVLFSMIGMLPIPWILVGEMFPLRVRPIMAGVVIAIAQCFIFICVKLYNNMIDVLGFSGTIFTFFAASALTMLYAKYVLPETRGKSLDEIEAHFRGAGPEKGPAHLGRGFDNAAFTIETEMAR